MNGLTLGSLFDGSGAFPWAGLKHGITPIFALEITPFAIRVTSKRIPQMRHVGDLTKLNGAELEPVDIVTMGSPCQNYPEEIVIPKFECEPCKQRIVVQNLGITNRSE